MKIFTDDEAVAASGCQAIKNLAANNEDNRKILSKNGACEYVTRCMEKFASSAEVQMFA